MRILNIFLLFFTSNITSLHAADSALITLVISKDKITVGERQVPSVQSMSVFISDDMVCQDIGKFWVSALPNDEGAPKGEPKYKITFSVLTKFSYDVLLFKDEAGSSSCWLQSETEMRSVQVPDALKFLNQYPFLKFK